VSARSFFHPGGVQHVAINFFTKGTFGKYLRDPHRSAYAGIVFPVPFIFGEPVVEFLAALGRSMAIAVSDEPEGRLPGGGILFRPASHDRSSSARLRCRTALTICFSTLRTERPRWSATSLWEKSRTRCSRKTCLQVAGSFSIC